MMECLITKKNVENILNEISKYWWYPHHHLELQLDFVILLMI